MRPSIESLSQICRTRDQLLPQRRHARRLRRLPGRHATTRPQVLGEFARNGWLNIVGGCCGTTPEWIAAIAEAVEGVAPRQIPDVPALVRPTAARSRWSIRPETNFVMVGERTNITGSRKFARLIKEGNFDEAIAVAREQVEDGANILDVNMDEGLIDGEEAMTRFLNLIAAEPDIAKRADHDRQLEVGGHRGRAEVRPGQVDRQLDQPEGGRGEVPRAGPARPALRRGGRRDGVRRGRARPSPRDRQGRDLRARLQAADRGGRLPTRRTSSSTPTS